MRRSVMYAFAAAVESQDLQTYIWRRMSAAAAAATPGGDSRGPRVGDLPRSRSVQQEQLAEGSDFESTATTGRPAAWPARSPDAPPDPATRRGGRETMPDERAAEEAARMTIRHGSGKSADAIMAGPEAAEAYHSNTAVQFVYQQQPSPDERDVGTGTNTERAAEQVAQQYREVTGTGTESSRGGPTDDIPELGGMAGIFAPHGEIGAEHGLRTPRRAGSQDVLPEGGPSSPTEAEMRGVDPSGDEDIAGRTNGGSGGGGRRGPWSNELTGNGISETIKAGVERLQDAYKQMFGNEPRGVDADRPGAGKAGGDSTPKKDGWNSP